MSRTKEGEHIMIKSIKQYAITIIIILAILVVNVLAYFQYSSNITEQLQQQTNIHLQAIIDETVECLNIKMEERMETYKAVATFIGNLKETDNFESTQKALENQADMAGYRDYDLISKEGIGLFDKGSIDYTGVDGFKKAFGGKSVMDIKTDDYGSIKGINYYVPITKDENITGVLKVFSTLEQFTTYTDISDLGEYGNVFIVKQDGTLLSRGYGLDEVDNIKMLLGNDKSSSKLINSMQSRKSGYISYNTGDAKRYLCYAKTAYNKWYMVSIVSATSIEVTNEDIANEGTVFFFEIAMLTTILMVYLVRMVVVESRHNELNRKRYYIVSKYSDSIVIDYSGQKDTMYCNEKWKKIFGYEPSKENLKENITRYVADSDKERFKEIIDVLVKEKEFVKFQIAINDKDGNPISCIVKLSAIKTRRGKVEKILGVIEPCSQNI